MTAAQGHLRLAGAISTPSPVTPPRVVVGAGGSGRTLERAVGFADEVNVYGDLKLVEKAVRLAESAPSRPDVSVFIDWSWTQCPRTWRRGSVASGTPE